MQARAPDRTRDARRAAPPDTLHFERYELKYCVPEHLTGAIRQFALPYVRQDEHARGRPGGRYTIHNVYLDTPRFDFYRACVHGDVERMKLRVRWYDEAAEGPFFLEVKRKVRRVIVKDRVKVSRSELDELFAPDGPEALRYHARPELREFLGRMTYTGARPVIFVRYTREPYESVFGNYARITFDRAICFQDANGMRLPEDPRAWCFTDAAWATKGTRAATILELKTTTDVPRWMCDLIKEFDLQRIGFSKYATSIRHREESAWGRLDGERLAAVGR
jgi:hypothetical protein